MFSHCVLNYLTYFQGHGFLTMYNGPDLSHTIKGLTRNTEYRFRVSFAF